MVVVIIALLGIHVVSKWDVQVMQTMVDNAGGQLPPLGGPLMTTAWSYFRDQGGTLRSGVSPVWPSEEQPD